MKCPYCNKDDDRVVDSRSSDDGFAIRRRRVCDACGRRYTTYERIESPKVKVVKRDGARVPFERGRIKEGLERACWKRPIPEATLETIVSDVEHHIAQNYESEVESRVLGELLMDRLRELDQVAYVRFASVYRKFNDAKDFADEVRPMLGDEGAEQPEA
jgi:transcriptional repressor NrdR